ncbi:hypothetical protein JJQ72_00580 [Paenibacillus sp. F411]|uniref:Sporulation membrane protein YtrI C-terminal domain-containing protein n=1 Tax=Paenibacillus algicola TaxID=2565926 RepID=A0A4P8XP85_9BACL|nr:MULTISPECIES: hypothetical protein [Paenibacillus]MBO2942484.1 hypothetical protein [Paenibacillus sp. F411]QCT03580.1 hypothetical protein E6C60_2869 [Paenibacillus algicola]
MRVPQFRRYRHLYHGASLLVLGMVIGSIVYNSLYHASYNKLWMNNRDMQIQISQYEEDIQNLKKYNKQPTVIREIKLRAEQKNNELDSLVIKEILQLLGKDLAALRGRSVFDIDTDSKLARSLLEDKLYKIRDKSFTVKIRTMLVMEGVLQIWVEIDMKIQTGGDS